MPAHGHHPEFLARDADQNPPGRYIRQIKRPVGRDGDRLPSLLAGSFTRVGQGGFENEYRVNGMPGGRGLKGPMRVDGVVGIERTGTGRDG